MGDWVEICDQDAVLTDVGCCVKVGNEAIAIFCYDDGKEWYALQNVCPHKQESVLSRGLVGCEKGEPKVSCPLHKNNFSLKTGKHLGGNEAYHLKTYPIRVDAGKVYLKV